LGVGNSTRRGIGCGSVAKGNLGLTVGFPILGSRVPTLSKDKRCLLVVAICSSCRSTTSRRSGSISSRGTRALVGSKGIGGQATATTTSRRRSGDTVGAPRVWRYLEIFGRGLRILKGRPQPFFPLFARPTGQHGFPHSRRRRRRLLEDEATEGCRWTALDSFRHDGGHRVKRHDRWWLRVVILVIGGQVQQPSFAQSTRGGTEGWGRTPRWV
jgi:hypothetical protein